MRAACRSSGDADARSAALFSSLRCRRAMRRHAKSRAGAASARSASFVRPAEVGRRAKRAACQQQIGEPQRADGVPRGGARLRAARGDATAQPGEARRGARVRGERGDDGRKRFRREHIPVARAAENPGQPLDLDDQRVARGRRRNEPEARPQPARSDPHLVDPFGIGDAEESCGVSCDLLETAARDDAKRILGGGAVGKRRGMGAHRRAEAVRGALRERIAALGLVRAADRERHVLRERLRESEQGKRAAGDDLHLDLGDRDAAPAGANGAGIDRERRTRSARKRERNRMAHELGGELRREQVLLHGLHQHPVPGRRRKMRDVERRPRDAALVLASRVQTGAAPGQGRPLDRLQPARAIAAQTQRDAVAREAQIRGVVVGAEEVRRARAAMLHGGNRRMPREARGAAVVEHARIERELEFYLGGHGIASGMRVDAITPRPRSSLAAGGRHRREFSAW